MTADTTLSADWCDGFRRGFDVGSEAGLAVGFEQGYDRRDLEIQAHLGVIRRTLKQPTYAELQKRRQHTNEPCSTHCGKCSRCTRAEAAARNLKRFGSPDFPGMQAESSRHD